jgi:hypothetical protein
MGARLASGFQIAQREGGLQVQVRLAMKFGMSGEAAKSAPDNPQNVQKMQTVLQELLGKPVTI